MPVRVNLAIYAAYGAPRQKAGKIRLERLPQPAAGNNGIIKTKRMIQTPANQKFGTAIPVVASSITPVSTQVCRHNAAITPASKPTDNPNARARIPREAETGKPWAIIWFTLKSVYIIFGGELENEWQ